MSSLFKLLTTIVLLTNHVYCYHHAPIKHPNDDSSVTFSQQRNPQINVQIIPETLTRDECADQCNVYRQQQQQQLLNSINSPYPSIIGYNSQLPAPVLQNYVDSRYANVLPPLPNIVNVNNNNNNFPNPILQNPVLIKGSGSLLSTSSLSLQNPQLNTTPLDQLIRQQQTLNNGFLNTPSLQTINGPFLNSVPLNQDGKFIRPGLEVAFQWRFVDWVYPNAQLTGKNFTIGNPLTQDVDIDRRGRVFVTTPQWLPGVPITLSTLTNANGPGGPLLTPYPDWQWHTSGCNGLVSVYRVAIDECDRLWMVDTGVAGRSICPMKIVVFDLKTDKPILVYTIPESQTIARTASYINPIVEVGDTCNNTYLYVADVIKHGLLVYSLRENRSWRLDNTPGNAFGNDPEANVLTIAGEAISLTDGTLGIALSPRGFFSKRYLYFNSLASFYQKFADSDSLKRSFLYDPIIYQSLNKRVSQAGVQAISRTGASFFQLAQLTALACWNIERPFTPENVVILARDEITLQYISGIKVITNALGEEELWFNTNRLQKTINNSRKIDEINFRFIKAKVNELIKGTKCEPSGYRGVEPNLLGWKRV